ncbi:MAG TPA: protein-glutamate O-methyltransferase CheR [Paludibacter sp.]|nr:protein-glutamate O-methyltransferase CheR [Paludibacter sp.]
MKNSKKFISEMLLQKHGIDVLKYENAFLEKNIEKRISETQCDNKDTYCLLLKNNLAESEKLIECFTVSYSEFFRNSLTFSVLEKIILPSLVMNKRVLKSKEIRIWSSACAAGQETYSVAMLLHESLSNANEPINYRVFATDFSPEQIQLAQSGEYPETALSNINLFRLNQWFTKQGNLYTINEVLKQNIDFSVFDLFNTNFSCPPASIFGNFDIVFCANLLFYYSPEFRAGIIEKVNNSLADNGLLITSETEREMLIQAGFKEVYPQSAIFRKNHQRYH